MIEKIVFHDQKSGRVILSVMRDDDKPCRIIGKANCAIELNSTIKAVGLWKKDVKYGWQFMTESIDALSDDDYLPKDDGMMHALDFSNLLNKSLKPFRVVYKQCDYKADDTEQKIFIDKDGVIYSPDMTTIYHAPSDISSLDIPKKVTTIGPKAFRNCKSLTEVNIPQSVTTIGKEAFAGCTNLDHLIILASIQYIGSGAFDGCKNFVFDKLFTVQWDYVRFIQDKIIVTIRYFDYIVHLSAEFNGAKATTNDIKPYFKSIMPSLQVQMISKDECKIKDLDKLKQACILDITKDIEWKDVTFNKKHIKFPSPAGILVDCYDSEVDTFLNDILEYLKQQIPALRVHFSTVFDAEILNIDELHEIAIVLNIKNNFPKMVANPQKLHEYSKYLTKHHKLFTPREKSPYIKYLFDNHDFEKYPIIPVTEGEGESAEKGILFTVQIDGRPNIVWENFKDSRASYVFACTDENYTDRRQLIFDFIMSPQENKRSYLRTNACHKIFGEKPRMIVHNNLESWSERLMNGITETNNDKKIENNEKKAKVG